MTWDEALEELSHRHTLAEAMGGEEKVARQHHFGKLTIRERIEAIVDPGSFREIGKLAGVGQYNDQGELIELTPSNFVFGTATIDHRPVMISGDDFTVRGGSATHRLPVSGCKPRAWPSNSNSLTSVWLMAWEEAARSKP